MASPASVPQSWACPGCGKKYRILPGKRPPALCPACRRDRAGVPAESSVFEQLSAVVAADLHDVAHSGRNAPPAEPPPPLQFEPTPFERLYPPVEVGGSLPASTPPAPGTGGPGPAASGHANAAPAVSGRRPAMSGRRQVVLVVGIA